MDNRLYIIVEDAINDYYPQRITWGNNFNDVKILPCGEHYTPTVFSKASDAQLHINNTKSIAEHAEQGGRFVVAIFKFHGIQI